MEYTVRLPSFAETRSALEVVRTFIESRSDVSPKTFDKINFLEDFLDKEKFKAARQTKITDFYKCT